MKKSVSITLPEELIKSTKKLRINRSKFCEEALSEEVARLKPVERAIDSLEVDRKEIIRGERELEIARRNLATANGKPPVIQE